MSSAKEKSGPHCENIDRLKKDPVSQSLINVFPDVSWTCQPSAFSLSCRE